MSSFEKRKTVDKTYPFSAFPANCSTFDKKSQADHSISSNTSLSPQVQLSNPLLLPLLLQLKSQNQHFSSQRQHLQQQTQSLLSLSKSLLSENQALRMHFRQRSVDIQQLVKSFSVNVDHNLQEVRHLVHLYRQHNCMLAKQIKGERGKIGDCQQRITEIQGRLTHLSHENNKKEELLRTRKTKTKILQSQIAGLEQKKRSLNLQSLQQEISALLLNCHNLKSSNISTIAYLQSQKSKLSAQKPQIRNKAIDAIKSVKMLQQEYEIILADSRKYEAERDLLAQQGDQVRLQLADCYRQGEGKLGKLAGLAERKKNMEDMHSKRMESIETLKQTAEWLQKQKCQLQKSLKSAEQSLTSSMCSHTQSLSNLSETRKKASTSLRQQHLQQIHQIAKTLQQDLNPEEQELQSQIAFYRSQLQALDGEIQDMRNKVQAMPDFGRDIVRAKVELGRVRGWGRW